MKTTLSSTLALSVGFACALALAPTTTSADQIWQQRYDGPGHGDDRAKAVAVDADRNVIVTGSSKNVDGNYDFYTAKYSADGTTILWSNRYDGPLHGDDLPTALAVDASNNVVVAGYSFDITGYPNLCFSGNRRILTVKYNAADGSVLWTNQGPHRENLCSVASDAKTLVAIDGSGDVILAGTSDDADPSSTINSGPYRHFYTAKYKRATGEVVWEQHYRGPTFACYGGDFVTGMAVDRDGNVIVTGDSGSACNLSYRNVYTVKYAPDGTQVWDAWYFGPLNPEGPFLGYPGPTNVRGIAADDSGNVIISGSSTYDAWAPNENLTHFYYTLKYRATDGQLLWEQRYQTPPDTHGGIAVDSEGNVAVAAASPPNSGVPGAFSFTAKYSANGDLLWLSPYQSCNPGGDYPQAIAMNRDGDVVVTGVGYAGDTVGYGHFHTIRYAATNGQVLWQQNYIGPGNLNQRRDHAMALAIDSTDKVIVTGESQNANGDYDYVTLKYDPSHVISVSTNPVVVGTQVEASASFSEEHCGPHTASWNWGDGTTSVGGVIEANGTVAVSGQHIYSSVGVYTLALTITDQANNSRQISFQYVVVYDSSAGFVTGNGLIDSPAGAYAPDPSLTGTARFAFVSGYQHGAQIPNGHTRFQFHVADLDFQSSAYEWLVVAGAKAIYKGVGTINGAGNVGFLLSAVDGDVAGGGGSDKFRIKLVDRDTGQVIFDNQMGAPEDATSTTAIKNGTIMIHK